MALRVEEGRGR